MSLGLTGQMNVDVEWGGSMPIVTGRYTLDRSKLPTKADELRVRFVPQLVNDENTLLVLYPNSDVDHWFSLSVPPHTPGSQAITAN